MNLGVGGTEINQFVKLGKDSLWFISAKQQIEAI